MVNFLKIAIQKTEGNCESAIMDLREVYLLRAGRMGLKTAGIESSDITG